MKIVKQSAVYLGNTNLEEDTLTPYERVERCGRICYKSEDRIDDGTAIGFCRAMLKNKHHAMLEHGVIYTRVSRRMCDAINEWLRDVKNGLAEDNITPFLNITTLKDFGFISLSFRVVATALKYLADMTDEIDSDIVYDYFKAVAKSYSELFNEKTIAPLGENIVSAIEKRGTDNGMSSVKIYNNAAEFIRAVKNLVPDETKNVLILKKHVVHTIIFTTNRGVTHELVRHRPASPAQESTRYCDYSKDKFEHSITVIEPCYYRDRPELMALWKKNAEAEEAIYFEMTNAGAVAQEARGNLLHDVKADLAFTATENEWQHIIDLRYHGVTGAPHPQAKEAIGCALPDLIAASSGRLS